MKLPLNIRYSDDFQTPPEALEFLYPYLPSHWKIWEPAAGQGLLVAGLREHGYEVEGSDITTGDDFLVSERNCNMIVTNPPFSLKLEFLERCYALGKPFALLLPLTALETEKRQRLFREHGIEIILLPRRINFVTPNKRESSSWFATAWFTHGLNIGRQLTFSQVNSMNKKKRRIDGNLPSEYGIQRQLTPGVEDFVLQRIDPADFTSEARLGYPLSLEHVVPRSLLSSGIL